MTELKQTQNAERGPILCVVGARPNFMKMAPLLRAFGRRKDLPRALLVHTGQHYDFSMKDQLFADLDLPTPDINLEVGSGSHAQQTAEVMKRFEPVVSENRPSCVIVVGDVNSTLACSLVASKLATPDEWASRTASTFPLPSTVNDTIAVPLWPAARASGGKRLWRDRCDATWLK